MKVYGPLEVAQLEWFTNAGKPAAGSYPYRAIWVTDTKQVMVSDGVNWVVLPSSDADTTMTGANTFSGTTTLSGTTVNSGFLEFGVWTEATASGAGVSFAHTKVVNVFTNASLTSIGAFSTHSAGEFVIITNKTGNTITISNEDTGQTAADRILTGTGANVTLANNASTSMYYSSQDSRWHIIDNYTLPAMAQSTIKGRASGAGTGAPSDLTAQQARDIIATTCTKQVFNSGTSATYTTPANCKRIVVELVGGGGGGGGGGTAAGGTGGTGGTTSFGTLSATGGAGGASGGSGGAGGAGTVGAGWTGEAFSGQGGGGGTTGNASTTLGSGIGGSSIFGGGGQGVVATTTGGAGATNSGSGGAGASQAPAATCIAGGGGGGGGGVKAFINNPAATYTYTVGGGGTGGAAGTSGVVGGAGAAGRIIVWEYYI